MTVGKFCNREVVIAERDTEIRELARLMRNHHVGDVVIVDNREGQTLPVGIVTDRDLVVELLATDLDCEQVTAGDLIGPGLLVALEEESLWEALKTMKGAGVRRLPVVNRDGELEGLLTLDDVLELLAEELVTLSRIPGREQEKETRLRE